MIPSSTTRRAAPVLNSRVYVRLIVQGACRLAESEGVCSFSLYELNIAEIEELFTNFDPEQTRELLKRLDVFQYFYSAADQLALGFGDRENLAVSNIVERLEVAPVEGRALGNSEIIETTTKTPQVVEAL